jgi:hypothetical protein
MQQVLVLQLYAAFDVLSASAQATHPALADSTDLRAFLEDNEGEWQVEVHPLPFVRALS